MFARVRLLAAPGYLEYVIQCSAFNAYSITGMAAVVPGGRSITAVIVINN